MLYRDWTFSISFKNTKNYQLNYKHLDMIPKIIEFTKQAYMGPKEAYTYSAKRKRGKLTLALKRPRSSIFDHYSNLLTFFNSNIFYLNLPFTSKETE